MPPIVKTSVLIAACLVIAVACAPGSEQHNIADAAPTSENTPMLKAGPIDLAQLAALAASRVETTEPARKPVMQPGTYRTVEYKN